MVPPDSFSISAAQATSDGFSGCCGGTQDDIFSTTVLSCAMAGGAKAIGTATSAVAARMARRFIGMHVSPWCR